MHPLAVVIGSLVLAILISEFVAAMIYLSIRWRL